VFPILRVGADKFDAHEFLRRAEESDKTNHRWERLPGLGDINY